MTQDVQELDRKELKSQALRERVAMLTAEYEDKVADLRVELTVVTQQANQRIAELEQQLAQAKESNEVPSEAPASSAD